MKKTILAATAFVALAACGGGEDSGAGETAETEAPETEAPTMLANGAPAFGEVADGDIERDEAEGARHEIAYLSGGSLAEIVAFYSDYYAEAGYEIYEGGVTFRAEDRDYGGYVQVYDQGEQIMVHVSPNVGSGSYDLAENLGDGFPVYPGVPAEGYDVRPRSNGSRLVIFRLVAEASDVLDFYREAGAEAGFEESNASIAARTDGERVRIGVFDNGERRRVVATVMRSEG